MLPATGTSILLFTLARLLLKQIFNLPEAIFNTPCWEIALALHHQHVTSKAPVPKYLNFWNLATPTIAMWWQCDILWQWKVGRSTVRLLHAACMVDYMMADTTWFLWGCSSKYNASSTACKEVIIRRLDHEGLLDLSQRHWVQQDCLRQAGTKYANLNALYIMFLLQSPYSSPLSHSWFLFSDPIIPFTRSPSIPSPCSVSAQGLETGISHLPMFRIENVALNCCVSSTVFIPPGTMHDKTLKCLVCQPEVSALLWIRSTSSSASQEL